MSILSISVVAASVSAVVVFLATPLVIKYAKRLGAIDDPKKSSHPKVVHEYPVPRSGGLAVFLGLLIASVIFLPLDQHLAGILIGATLVVLVGLADDKYDLNPYLRLGLGFAAAAVPIAAGIGIAFIKLPIIPDLPILGSLISTNQISGITDLSHPQIAFHLFGELRSIWILSDLFALFWIVLMMNMLNMGAKGVDGQLPGVVVVAALTIAALSFRFSADITQWPVIILALITAGAYLGFLPWNFYPQKIMPGYGGATLAGYLLAILSILSTAKVGTLAIVLAVPLIDTGYTIIRRVIQGKSPVWGDTGHLHHRLMRIGWGKRRIAIFYWMVSAALGVLALNLNSTSKLYTIVGVAVLLAGFILWLTYKPNIRTTKK